MSPPPLISALERGLSKASYRTLLVRHEDPKMDQGASPAPTLMQASPRRICTQEVNWPLPLATVSLHFRRSLRHEDVEVLANTQPVTRKEDSGMKHFKDLLPCAWVKSEEPLPTSTTLSSATGVICTAWQ